MFQQYLTEIRLAVTWKAYENYILRQQILLHKNLHLERSKVELVTPIFISIFNPSKSLTMLLLNNYVRPENSLEKITLDIFRRQIHRPTKPMYI